MVAATVLAITVRQVNRLPIGFREGARDTSL
jgi:hypothetical protein